MEQRSTLIDKIISAVVRNPQVTYEEFCSSAGVPPGSKGSYSYNEFGAASAVARAMVQAGYIKG